MGREDTTHSGRLSIRPQKKKAVVLAVMMVFGGFLEMLSISLVLPFMKAVTSAGGAAGICLLIIKRKTERDI